MNSIVQTDTRGRVTLPGHPNERYALEETPEGALVLEPVITVTKRDLWLRENPDIRAEVEHSLATGETALAPVRPDR